MAVMVLVMPAGIVWEFHGGVKQNRLLEKHMTISPSWKSTSFADEPVVRRHQPNVIVLANSPDKEFHFD